MGKGKLQKFAEMAHFENVLQPDIKNYIDRDYELKGKWRQYFGNDGEIILDIDLSDGVLEVTSDEELLQIPFEIKNDDLKEIQMYDDKGNRIIINTHKD